MQVPSGKDRCSRNLSLKLEGNFGLAIWFYVRINRAIGKNIGARDVRGNPPVLIAKVTIRSSHWNRTLSTIWPGEAAVQICYRIVAVVRMVRRNIERSEEHTSELQSHSDLVCRLLLEKKKTQ